MVALGRSLGHCEFLRPLYCPGLLARFWFGLSCAASVTQAHVLYDYFTQRFAQAWSRTGLFGCLRRHEAVGMKPREMCRVPRARLSGRRGFCSGSSVQGHQPGHRPIPRVARDVDGCLPGPARSDPRENATPFTGFLSARQPNGRDADLFPEQGQQPIGKGRHSRFRPKASEPQAFSSSSTDEVGSPFLNERQLYVGHRAF